MFPPIQDHPSPTLTTQIHSLLLQKYLQQCIDLIDWKAMQSEEASLSTAILQDIFSIMQNPSLTDRECILAIDDIFLRRLQQPTKKGMQLKNEAQEET